MFIHKDLNACTCFFPHADHSVDDKLSKKKRHVFKEFLASRSIYKEILVVFLGHVFHCAKIVI